MVELQSAYSQITDKSQWLSLRDACRLLDVSNTTLRQWADNGYLRVYRTPGGHRRFLRSDVESFANAPEQAQDQVRDDAVEGSALRKIRRRLGRNDVLQQPWYQSVEEEGKVRMRLFGRRLLSILLQESSARRRRQELLDEAHLLGREYGTEMSERGVALKDTIEAFVFFRTMVLDSTNPGSWARIIETADRVLVGMADSY
ncbi:MAG: helix-turn-helix domain-containing protein [Chloroflexota bacterium]|nr:MAG: helix-turn-helix domain-containing protein [SAR202 cluster bacterium]MCH2670920.1 helix-turn-helix domain-containing protein [Dehalococcoidia bacterium]MEE3013184.1 helix-turn-helix domain-containing protein [Chloroflexota bacterium]GIS94846.1 MAG: DNA-binding protein [Dehalococcoidia bacterium]